MHSLGATADDAYANEAAALRRRLPSPASSRSWSSSTAPDAAAAILAPPSSRRCSSTRPRTPETRAPTTPRVTASSTRARAADFLDDDAVAPRLRVDVATGSPNELVTEDVPEGTALRVTLAWLDPAGARARQPDDRAPVLENDLDLSLVAPDEQTVFHPWSLDAERPEAAAVRDAPNRVDNVEVVDVDAADNRWTGAWTVRVESARPLLRNEPQAYALAASAPISSAATARRRKRDAHRARAWPRTGRPRCRSPSKTSAAARSTGRRPPTLRSSSSSERAGATVTNSSSVRTARTSARDASGSATITLESTEPGRPRTLGVLVTTRANPECGTRLCGPDPLCGRPCGGCAVEFACAPEGAVRSTRRAVPRRRPRLDSRKRRGLGRRPAARIGFPRAAAASSARTRDSMDCPTHRSLRLLHRGVGVRHHPVGSARRLRRFGDRVQRRHDRFSARPSSSSSMPANRSRPSWTVSTAIRVRSRSEFTSSAAPTASLVRGSAASVLPPTSARSIGSTAGELRGRSRRAKSRWASRHPWTVCTDSTHPDSNYEASVAILRDDCSGEELACGADSVELALFAGARVIVVIDGALAHEDQFALGVTTRAITCGADCAARPSGGLCACDERCVELGDCCVDACGECATCTPDQDCEFGRCIPRRCTGGNCGCDPRRAERARPDVTPAPAEFPAKRAARATTGQFRSSFRPAARVARPPRPRQALSAGSESPSPSAH